MQIITLDRQTPAELLQSLLIRIRNILADLEYCYPNFSLWIEKVFRELKDTDKRKIILVTDQNWSNILGVTIIKNTVQEKKICTLRVLKEYQDQGIGTILLKEAIKELKDPLPLITVSELQINTFKPFLERYGFVIKDKVKSLYRDGMYEYFFNKKHQHTAVLLSIRPIYAEPIINGEKKIEFRKKIFDSSVTRVYVYSSSPVKLIIGYFDIGNIEESTPDVLWNKYKQIGRISKRSYFDYYANHEHAYGIIINNVVRYSIPIEPKTLFNNFRAPQSFFYVDNVSIRHCLDSGITCY